MNTHLDEPINRWCDGKLSDEELRRLTDALATPEGRTALRGDWFLEAAIPEALRTTPLLKLAQKLDPMAISQTRKWTNWLSWRPLTAAAAGLATGMFCTSVLFAYTQPSSPVVVNKVLPLADAEFESGSQVLAQGIPARAGAWGGDFSRMVVAENGITPKHGQRMLCILRADHELSSKNARSYVGSVAQVIDLRPLRAELSGGESLVEVSAQFNAIPMPQRGLFDFNVKAAAFRGDIADAPRLWEDHESSVSRSARTVGADSDAATWQRVSMPLVVPMDADFLVIEAAVVSKAPQSPQSVAEFPGHYVDQVEVRLNGSANAWAVLHNAK